MQHNFKRNYYYQVLSSRYAEQGICLILIGGFKMYLIPDFTGIFI